MTTRMPVTPDKTARSAAKVAIGMLEADYEAASRLFVESGSEMYDAQAKARFKHMKRPVTQEQHEIFPKGKAPWVELGDRMARARKIRSPRPFEPKE